MGGEKVNILFFYESMTVGGQQTQTYNIIKTLAAKGHKVHWVYLFGDGMQQSVSLHARIEKIGDQLGKKDYLFRPWKLLPIVHSLSRYSKEHGIDVIISGSGLGSLLSGLASRVAGMKHYRLIGCSLVQVEKTLYRLYRWIGIDNLIDGYFGWPAVFNELACKGVSADKCHELNDAVDTKTFFPLPEAERDAFRQSLGIQPGDLVIGWIGRISADMQVGNTVALGKELLDRGFKDFKLLLVGGGPWLEDLKQLIRDYGLEGCSILTDWVPWTEVNRYANAMDVVPLLEEDPQGGSIVREAMACGRVALSVDGRSGTQRRFMSPETSVLVPPGQFITKAADEIERLATDSCTMKTLGSNARCFAQTHMSFDAQVCAMLRVFDSGNV